MRSRTYDRRFCQLQLEKMAPNFKSTVRAHRRGHPVFPIHLAHFELSTFEIVKPSIGPYTPRRTRNNSTDSKLKEPRNGVACVRCVRLAVGGWRRRPRAVPSIFLAACRLRDRDCGMRAGHQVVSGVCTVQRLWMLGAEGCNYLHHNQ